MPFQTPYCAICRTDASIFCYQFRHIVTCDLCGGTYSPRADGLCISCGHRCSSDNQSVSSEGNAWSSSDGEDSIMEGTDGIKITATPQCLSQRISKIIIGPSKDNEDDTIMANTQVQDQDQDAGVQGRQGGILKGDFMDIDNASLELFARVFQTRAMDDWMEIDGGSDEVLHQETVRRFSMGWGSEVVL